MSHCPIDFIHDVVVVGMHGTRYLHEPLLTSQQQCNFKFEFDTITIVRFAADTRGACDILIISMKVQLLYYNTFQRNDDKDIHFT